MSGALGAALDWVRGNRSGFVLPGDVLEPHSDVNRTMKPLGELAQLCTTVSRRTHPGDPHHATAAALVRFAWEQVREGGLLLDIARNEPFATYPFEIYAAFAGDGLRHEGFERLVSAVAATRGWAFTEQHANRELGLLNSERRIGVPPHTAAEPVLRRTWLGALPEPWTFERASGYALTHAVFHVTDWGNAPQLMPRDISDYLRTWLPAWIDGCFENGQWDLGGELLAVAACLPEPPPQALVETFWPVLAAVQDGTGAVPETGPPLVPGGGGQQEGGPGGEASADVLEAPREFLNCYHSTLVTAFAAALTLARSGPADQATATGTATAAATGRTGQQPGPDPAPAAPGRTGQQPDPAGRQDGGAV
ncbi:DUF6895 family protein [Streptomyces sp. NPDC059398]|uniref:DUF6895 family protein n=1 Tax=Streptomyces sp. NPDC059398 TaxID=3346820 RepID=UPI00369DE254